VPNTPDVTSCLEPGPVQDDAVLPVNPFLSVRYQFGMLLGVDDFDVAVGYPRGKVRLHNAWLHGLGVVWGFGVAAPPVSATDPTTSGELRVSPGLALDRLGHELHLDQPACVDVGAWYAEQKQVGGDGTLGGAAVVDAASGAVTAQLHIELRFKSCLTRQVPAMSEPCDGSQGTDTAYSRAFETVELKLVPGLSPSVDDRQPWRYPRLRLLFGVLAPKDPASPEPWEQEVLSARAAVASQADFLAALRRFAALDEIAAEPGLSSSGRRLLFPGPEDGPVILADLRDVKLAFDGKAYRMTAVDVHPEVRQAHIATSTIQELDCCGAPGKPVSGGAAPGPLPLPVPRPLPVPAPGNTAAPSAEASRDAADLRKLRLRSLAQPFDESTLDEKAFSVTQLGDEGWAPVDVKDIGLDPADATNHTILLNLRARPKGKILRLIARGTGPEPLMYAAVPAAGGAAAQPAAPFRGDHGRGSEHDGSDFVFMFMEGA
jgi:hypothetical protein